MCYFQISANDPADQLPFHSFPNSPCCLSEHPLAPLTSSGQPHTHQCLRFPKQDVLRPYSLCHSLFLWQCWIQHTIISLLLFLLYIYTVCSIIIFLMHEIPRLIASKCPVLEHTAQNTVSHNPMRSFWTFFSPWQRNGSYISSKINIFLDSLFDQTTRSYDIL